MIAALALTAIAVLVFRAIGSTIARVVGVLLVVQSLFWLANETRPVDTALTALGIGVGLWLFGHWLYAIKHRLWRSTLAMRVFALPVLHVLAPIPSRPDPQPMH